MPVIIRKQDLDTWLNCDDPDWDAALRLLKPLDPSEMVATPVSSLVNDPNNDLPEVLERIA
jgi:putative SOS response-associated peptidase YedK